jgi:hypothetical protein
VLVGFASYRVLGEGEGEEAAEVVEVETTARVVGMVVYPLAKVVQNPPPDSLRLVLQPHSPKSLHQKPPMVQPDRMEVGPHPPSRAPHPPQQAQVYARVIVHAFH